MPSDIYWIELPAARRLAIMARPRAGDWLDAEIVGWRGEGIDIVVSLLQSDEVHELGLRQEPYLCQQNSIEFIPFPIPDRGVPASPNETAVLVRSIAGWINDGKAVAIHCRAGIGRSSLIAACALVCTGINAGDAFEMIGTARRLRVPDTDEQRDWVTSFQQTIALAE